MKIEKVKSKLKKVFNRVMGVLLPVATLFVSCDTNALVAHAAESKTVSISSILYNGIDDKTEKYEELFTLPDGCEIYGVISTMTRGELEIYDVVSLYVVNYEGGQFTSGNVKWDFIQNITGKKNNQFPYKSLNNDYKVQFTISGTNIKLFKTLDNMKTYMSSGAGDYDIIKPDELEKGWYLKNVSYKVTADDSPSSEAGADATYIHFSWDIDNLQDGDLLEIKTKSYYKKILGEQLSGFHDFITKSDSVSAYEGKYSFSQYEATKAWFNSLENKPLVFKEYDTTDYYLRPYRQGQYGGWVHIKMGRSTPTSSPYIEDIEYGDFDDDNNWTVDEDLTDKNGGHHGVDQGGGYIPPDQSDNPFTGTNIAGIFSYFYDFMKQIPAMLGDLPALVGNIISFLPKPIIAFIGIGVLVAIILRIVGR